MSYVKTNWINGQTPINATNLNKIENQLEANTNDISNIIESGSNANGSYIKYSDGTMICYKTISGSVDITTTWGSLYTSSDVDLGAWPVYFISRPTITVTAQASSGTQYMLSTQSGSNAGTYYNAGSITMIRPNSRTGVAYILDVIGIGKWR